MFWLEHPSGHDEELMLHLRRAEVSERHDLVMFGKKECRERYLQQYIPQSGQLEDIAHVSSSICCHPLPKTPELATTTLPSISLTC